MVDFEFVLPWIQKAENDILTACHLAEKMYPTPDEIICFHCQQSVEKYLKAFLALNDKEPEKTRDLLEIVENCVKFDADFSILTPKCEYLTPFAVQTRYPGGSDPEEHEMKTALTYAEEIIKFVKAKLPLIK